MTNEDQKRLEQHVDAYIRDITEMHSAATAMQLNPEMFSDPDDAKAYGYTVEDVRRWIEDYGKDEDDITDTVMQYPLSVETRSGWTMYGDKPEAAEYRIVLGTGGPHIEIIGSIDALQDPDVFNRGEVKGYWGSSTVSRLVTDSLVWFAGFFAFDDWQ